MATSGPASRRWFLQERYLAWSAELREAASLFCHLFQDGEVSWVPSLRDDVELVSNLAKNGEQGLLGLALHWNYPTRPWLYAYATRHVNGTPYDEILNIVFGWIDVLSARDYEGVVKELEYWDLNAMGPPDAKADQAT